MKKVDPFYLGWTFAHNLPDPDESQITQPQIVDFATATKCLRWMATQDVNRLLIRSANNDCDGFIAGYEPFRKRLAALEHIAQQLRGKWARANVATLAVDIELLGNHYSSAHLALFCWGRAVRFCIWAAVNSESLLRFGADGTGRFSLADVPRKWTAVRTVLRYEGWRGFPGPLNTQLEAERDYLIDAERPHRAPGRSGVAIDDEDQTVLCKLHDAAPRSIKILDLAADDDVLLDRKTISKSLAKLEKANYVHRPDGPRSGYAITTIGADIAQNLPR